MSTTDETYRSTFLTRLNAQQAEIHRLIAATNNASDDDAAAMGARDFARVMTMVLADARACAEAGTKEGIRECVEGVGRVYGLKLEGV